MRLPTVCQLAYEIFHVYGSWLGSAAIFVNTPCSNKLLLLYGTFHSRVSISVCGSIIRG